MLCTQLSARSQRGGWASQLLLSSHVCAVSLQSLTYSKQSVKQPAPPSVGTVLRLCAHRWHSALPGVSPSLAHSGVGGQSSGISGALTSISEKQQRQTFMKAPAFYISLRVFWQDPHQSPQQQTDYPRTRPGFAAVWMPTSPCASLLPTCERALRVCL